MIRIRFRGCKSPIVAGGLAAALLAACGPDAPGPANAPDKVDSAEAGYVTPPSLESATRTSAGVTLSGLGVPHADVRLRSPSGGVVTARTDAEGRWSLTVRHEPGVRLFGLSTTREGRTVQAEGYVMVAEGGEVALLRAGAGAKRLAEGSSSPRILAVDLDRQGGAVVSGVAAPEAGLNVRVDRVTRGGGRADDDGRFFISLDHPLTPGAHDIQVAGDGGETALTVTTSTPAPLVSGPRGGGADSARLARRLDDTRRRRPDDPADRRWPMRGMGGPPSPGREAVPGAIAKADQPVRFWSAMGDLARLVMRSRAPGLRWRVTVALS